MEKYITDERTGLKYELVGDYYLIAGDDEPEPPSIGVLGHRHLQYLKQYRRDIFLELQMSGDLPDYLTDLDRQADEMYSRLVEQLAKKGDISETLKAENQMLWVQQMNSVRNSAAEIVNSELIYR